MTGIRIAQLAAFGAVLAVPAPMLAQKPGATPIVTAAYLVGRWGDNGDCSKDVVLAADGSFRSYTGGVGRWWLRGDQLTFEGGNGTFVMRVRWEGPNAMLVTNPDGSIGRSQRC